MQKRQQRRLPAWDVCRGHPVRATRLSRARHLSRLHAPHPSNLCGNPSGGDRVPSATPRRACRGDRRMHRRRRARDQPESRPCSAIRQGRTGAGAGARPRVEAWRDRRGGGRQSRGAGQFRPHAPSLGHPGCRLRSWRQTDERIESGRLDRQARVGRARRRRHQPEGRGSARHARRNERRHAFCDRRDRAVVVGISRRERHANQARNRRELPRRDEPRWSRLCWTPPRRTQILSTANRGG